MNLGGGIGWRFPFLDGGEGQGFENAGMAYFQGNLLGSLAREVIQNSLDAGLDGKTVEVTFELKDIALSETLDGDELRRHIEACYRACVAARRNKATDFFSRAIEMLDRPVVPFLCISDRNTTGLPDAQWRALVKTQGDSVKHDKKAGGSYGIGKNAPFAVSALRTVGYWTCLEEDDETRLEKFQAKAILMSHDWKVNGRTEETRESGFYGWTDGCRELRDGDVPPAFRMCRSGGDAVPGTAVWVAGFQIDGVWQRQVARSILRNYFYAIERGRLNVLLEPNESEGTGAEAYTELGNATLEGAFERLRHEDGSEMDDLGDAHIYWRMIRDNTEPRFQEDLPGLGLVRLWVKTEDDYPGETLPCKVAMIRGTGMLVTDHQSGLRQFRSLRDFAAVCVLESGKANTLLRRMENPAHDQFEPDRLLEQRQDGVAVLRRLTGWIRGRLRDVAAPKQSSVSEELDELARFLPFDAPSPLAGSAEGSAAEKAFGVAGEVLRKAPKRRIRPSRLETEMEDADGGEGNESGDYGGGAVGEGHRRGGGNGGRGDGDQRGGIGVRGGPRGGGFVGIRDVRILPEDGSGRRFRIAFTPEVTGRLRLEIEEAGDSTAQRLDGIVLRALNNKEVAKGVNVKAERRHSLRFASDMSLKGVALRLLAFTEDEA